MKIHNILLLFALTFILSECKPGTDCSDIIDRIETSFEKGYFTTAAVLTDSLKILFPDNRELIRKADSLIEISGRIRIDFPYDYSEIKSAIEKRMGTSVADDEIVNWENKRWLEFRYIDGEKKYFDRAASNLILLRLFYEDKETRESNQINDPAMMFRLKHTADVMKAASAGNEPVLPVDMIITYTLTVEPDAVPEGEIIRCWLPWPKGNHVRQKPPELISASNPEYIIAPDSDIHRSVYMEAKAEKGIPVIFNIKYKYQSAAQYFNPETIQPVPYNKESAIYKKYTSEQVPQIRFTDNVKKLADSIAGTSEDPALIVRKIYLWFKANIPWTGALEYSIMPDIPGYVIDNRRGDCGMQTLLFISMLRYKGIPVRWQSGWMVPPGDENLHDWCEVWYEGTGWIPADVSYNLQNSDDQKLKEFYITGIDSYRMIINDGISGNFYPEKQYIRSDPYDFQRGEVEWRGGNIYYDKWDYDMEIEYQKGSGEE